MMLAGRACVSYRSRDGRYAVPPTIFYASLLESASKLAATKETLYSFAPFHGVLKVLLLRGDVFSRGYFLRCDFLLGRR